MKKNLVFLFILIGCIQAFSQSIPQGMNYQAIARDNNGNELANTSLTVKLGLLSKSGSTYTTEWEETHAVTTNAYGLFTLVIGQGTTTGGGAQSSFSAISWSLYDMYLNVSINDGNGYVDLGKTQLISVPYAFVAGSLASSSSNSSWLLSGNSGTSTSTDFIGTTDNVDLLFKTNDAESMRLQSDGNVSIGSSSNWAKLYVEADSTEDPLRVRVEGITKFFVGSDGNVGVGTFSPKGLFHVDASDDFVVLESGNVGIGTSSPVAALHVSDGNVAIGTTSSAATVQINSGSSEDALRVQVNGSTKLWVQDNGATAIGAAESDVPDNGAYIKGQTLIGLSTTSSYYGTQNMLQAFYENTTNDAFYGMRSRVVGSGSSNYSNGNYAFYGRATDIGFNYGLYGEGSGGTYNYGVVGEADDVGVYAIGDMWYSGSLSKASDQKFKKNIKTIDNALTLIGSLKPKVYDYKLDEYAFMNFTDKPEFGFIAQEVEEVVPELVNTMKQPAKYNDMGEKVRDSFDFKGVNYVGMIPVLVKALQEQQQLIESQQTQIDLLEQKINDLITK